MESGSIFPCQESHLARSHTWRSFCRPCVSSHLASSLASNAAIAAPCLHTMGQGAASWQPGVQPAWQPTCDTQQVLERWQHPHATQGWAKGNAGGFDTAWGQGVTALQDAHKRAAQPRKRDETGAPASTQDGAATKPSLTHAGARRRCAPVARGRAPSGGCSWQGRWAALRQEVGGARGIACGVACGHFSAQCRKREHTGA